MPTQHTALDVLQKRYVGTDVAKQAQLQQQRVNAEIARTIHDLRQEAGLSQTDLAKLIGTTQSVISRLESDDYEGHSLSMLNRIATALDREVAITLQPKEMAVKEIQFAFREVLRGLRHMRGLTLSQLATKLDVDEQDLAELERSYATRPSPLLLHRLSRFYDIPQRNLAVLAGAIKNVPATWRDQVSQFAAKSDSFAKLSAEDKRILDDFVKFLRHEVVAHEE